MIEVLIVGSNELASDYIQIFSSMPNMKIIAIIVTKKEPAITNLSHGMNIEVIASLNNLDTKKIDYIIETTGNEKIMKELQAWKNDDTTILSKSILTTIKPFLMDRNEQFQKIALMANLIEDGLIMVNSNEEIQFINKAASKIIGVEKHEIVGKKIKEIIHNTRLPNVLQNQKKEVNQKLIINKNKEVITTRIPLINKQNRLVGAFAMFQDSIDVIRIAEENTDFKEIKTILQAVIRSSDEAISVVDENGYGLMINSSYKKLTGLSEEEVIGMPATVDISEGKSMHLHVLRTRRPVRGVKMKVGPNKKDVIVNVSPIIVAGKLKGSVAVIHDVSKVSHLTVELKQAKQIIRNLEATYTFADIIGSSPEMMIAIEQAKTAAKTDATVLLRGDSGTEKDLFAHAIHNESNRKHNKFIRINCAAYEESALEIKLFGSEKGISPKNNYDAKKGLFEQAKLGTVFLNEIGELSLSLQAKLLRILKENVVVRVGGTTKIPVDVRIITATKTNLEKAITNKTFREDLYYRLNRFPVYIPSLQERIIDLPRLIQGIIMKGNQIYGRNVQSISDEALTKLSSYHWPRNIKELDNVICRAIIFMSVTEKEITLDHLAHLQINKTDTKLNMAQKETEVKSLQDAMDQYEKEYIYRIYKECNFNKTATAKKLNISVRNLYYKIEKYELD